MELRLCGGVEVEVDGTVLAESLLGGRQGRLVLAYLACERGRAVRREELADLLWPDQLPESWTTSLSAVISRLRRLFVEAGFDGTSVVVSTPGAYQLVLPPNSRVDVEDLADAVRDAEEAAAGDHPQALAAAARAEAIAARGFLADDCEWVDARRYAIRDLRVRSLVAQSAAHVGAGTPARAVEAARRAVELDGVKESAYRQLMVALAAAGERAEALRVWERCRITLVEDLGVDPSPETEAVYLSLLEPAAAAVPATALPSGVVTFLLTDIVESSALWEGNATAMAAALERHDAIVASIVAAHGGALLKSKLEGDATVSVFARATECAIAALALVDAIASERWPDGAHPRLRMAMHTGEAFERGGDYFGPALNRAARLRSLAAAGEVLLSQAVAELVRDHLPAGVELRDRGMQTLRGLSRAENVFQLTRLTPKGDGDAVGRAVTDEIVRPPVPGPLTGSGPFVGRGDELETLGDLWRRASTGEPGAVFVGGEPGVGKSRLAGEIAQRAYTEGALVLYGRCDEDLAAPLQPFIEAVRALAPALGAARLRAVRGVDELTRVVPALTELLGEKPGVRADPDTERLALFDAVTQLFVAASNDVPVLVVLDDLHWAGKTTLSLLRHVLRGTKTSRLLVVGTYRDTELARSHPLAETLADLRRDTGTYRIALDGLAEADVAAYLTAIGNDDRALGHELAEVTAGNPFFLIEVVRHVQESGGSWQPGSLPEGVREATGRRLSRLSDTANDALAVAAVAGTTFDLSLVEQVRGVELVDAIAEAVQAGLVVEEPGSFARFRFAHAIVRQVLLSELVSLKRVRLHRTIAELLEAAPPDADADARLADLAYHWFECAAAGSASNAVEACRRAGDRAMERLAYEEAGDLYGMALQALEWIDDPDTDTAAALHLARCDALLTAGDVAGASAAIDALEVAAAGSERLAAWYTTYEGLLAVLGEPDRLTEIVQSIGAAAGAMRDVGDLTGEAKARYVHASALERLGQIGAAERALDAALAAARTAGDRRLADAILAEAPPAALWGPSPVTRASGRCLDVVRVLRITSGTPAVEAVALRCQAVLEALRGRMDAARRMIGSSRRTVEQLGLTLRRLETELAAGLIELLDGEAVAAEELLRTAHDGLRERGLDGEAAQAAAFLGRALLLQDRVDEADDAAATAEALAGSDLKAAITWRDVRAEVATRRGDVERALALAREAVELASATDALLLVADARLTLAGVLRAAGDDAAADAEAREAVGACEAKGATVLAALARATAGVTPSAAARPTEARLDTPAPNLAFSTMIRFQRGFNDGDWDAVHESRAGTWRLDDRRPVVGMTLTGDVNDSSGTFARAGGGRFERPELIATRGDRFALCRWTLRSPGIEVPFLAIAAVDADGRGTDFVMFEPEALDDAIAALDAMAAATAFENDATRAALRFDAVFNSHDLDAIIDAHADGYTLEERRPPVRATLDRDQLLETMRLIHAGGGTIHTEIIATRGRKHFAARITLHVPAPEAAATVLMVSLVDDAGRYVRGVSFDADDLDAALAELDRMYTEDEGVDHADVLFLVSSFIEALRARDTTRARSALSDDLVVHEHGAVSAPALAPDAWFASLWETLDVFGKPGLRVERITDLSDDGGLWTMLTTGVDRDGGVFELPWLMAVRVADGRIARLDLYSNNDVAAARAALCGPASAASEENDASRNMAHFRDAYRARDWDAVVDTIALDSVSDDRRSLVRNALDHDGMLASIRLIFDGDGTLDFELLTTRGSSLCLARWAIWLSDFDATDTVLVVAETNEAGRLTRHFMFDADDIEGAYAQLECLWLERADGNAAWRGALAHRDAYNAGDWQAFLDATDPAIVYVDRRHAMQFRLDGVDALDGFRPGFAIDDFRYERTLLATRGDNLSLSRDHVVFVDGEAGPAEVDNLAVVETGPDGRVRSHIAFNVDDVETAYAALDARHAELTTAIGNAAWQASLRLSDAQNRQDWDAVVEVLDPSYVYVDHRQGIRLRVEGDEAFEVHRVAVSVDEIMDVRTLIASRGERLALSRDRVEFVTGAAGRSEVEVLTLIECGADGRIVMGTGFDVDDLDSAIAALDERHSELGNSEGNVAWSTVRRWSVAINRHDWPGVVACLDPAYTAIDHRYANRMRFEGPDALDSLRVMFDLDNGRHDCTLIDVRGDRLVLHRFLVSFVDGLAGPSEVEGVALVECGPDGRLLSNTAFDADELDAAYALLEARHAEIDD